MGLSVIILNQTLTMGIYMSIGYLLFRFRKITTEGSRNLAALLLWVILPATIINSFCVDYSLEKLWLFIHSFLLGIAALFISILIARLLFPKAVIDNFAAAFSNAGFMGIPLVKASFGEEAVFFLVGFVALLNLLQWTYGVSLMQKSKHRIRVKDILLNPIFAAIIVGILIFVSGFGSELPTVIKGALSGVSAMNAPLAMIVLGVYLAQTDIRSTFTTIRLYTLSGIRLLLIPLVTMLLLKWIPGDNTVKLVILTAAAAPVGSNVAVYAQLHDEDYPYACQTVAVSTVLSVLSLPAVLAIGNSLFL